MTLTTAVTRIQTIALACTSVTIKAAPAKIVEDAMMLPMSLCYPAFGTGYPEANGSERLLPTVHVDIHFSRLSLVQAYTQIQLLIPEFLQRLGGDPTLNGTVDTIEFPVTFQVTPFEWDTVLTEMVRFIVPLKIRTTTTATA